MFISVHTVLVVVFCVVVTFKVLSTLLWPAPKKFVKRDYFVNNLIENVRYVIANINEDAISIPDIILTIPADPSGQFWATSGWVRNMTSLKRTDEEISVQFSDSTENVEFSAYLQRIKVTFNHFKINVSNVETYGSIDADVNTNLFRIKLGIEFLSTGNCTTSLNQLALEECNGFKVNVSNTEGNPELTANIKNWVSDDILILVRHRLEEYFTRVFNYVLAKQDFCIDKPGDDDEDDDE